MGSTLVYFDKAERDRIRDALRRYMKDNRIGAPKLRDLIAEANGMSARRDGKEPIALSTVQRFISDAHRANDSFVGLCARFTDGFPKSDPITTFGAEAASFLGIEHDSGGGSCRCRPKSPGPSLARLSAHRSGWAIYGCDPYRVTVNMSPSQTWKSRQFQTVPLQRSARPW